MLKNALRKIFEKNCLESVPEQLDLKRIIIAKQTLWKKFYGKKEIKKLIAKSTPEEAI